jgi:hypothetical protein
MSDTLSPRARSFLESVRNDDDPTSADFERVAARLEAALAASIAAGIGMTAAKAGAATSQAAAPATSAVTTWAGGALVTKVGAAVAVAGLLAGGGAAIGTYVHRAEHQIVATRTNALPPARGAAALAQTPMSAAAASEDARILEAPMEMPVASASPRRADAPIAPPKQRAVTGRTRVVATPAEDRPSPLDAEIAMIRAAHVARRDGNPAGALALLRDHDARFPTGALSEDSAAERIYALCALGRIDDAHELAVQFITAHPASPHAAAIRASCGLAARK